MRMSYIERMWAIKVTLITALVTAGFSVVILWVYFLANNLMVSCD